MAATAINGTHVDAQILLELHGADVHTIDGVHADAILYRDSLGRPKTGWTRLVGATLRVALQHGWPAVPSADCERQLARED